MSGYSNSAEAGADRAARGRKAEARRKAASAASVVVLLVLAVVPAYFTLLAYTTGPPGRGTTTRSPSPGTWRGSRLWPPAFSRC